MDDATIDAHQAHQAPQSHRNAPSILSVCPILLPSTHVAHAMRQRFSPVLGLDTARRPLCRAIIASEHVLQQCLPCTLPVRQIVRYNTDKQDKQGVCNALYNIPAAWDVHPTWDVLPGSAHSSHFATPVVSILGMDVPRYAEQRQLAE